MLCFFFFQAEDGIRDRDVMEFRRVLFRSACLLVGFDALTSLGLYAPGQTFMDGVYSTQNLPVLTGGRKVREGDEVDSLDHMSLVFDNGEFDFVDVADISKDGVYTTSGLVIQGCIPEVAVSPEVFLKAPITALLMEKFGAPVALGANVVRDSLLNLIGVKGGVGMGSPNAIARTVSSFFKKEE